MQMWTEDGTARQRTPNTASCKCTVRNVGSVAEFAGVIRFVATNDIHTITLYIGCILPPPWIFVLAPLVKSLYLVKHHAIKMCGAVGIEPQIS